MFVVIALPAVKSTNFEPFLPGGWGSPLGGVGVLGAAASIFFAYVGFDAVSTAAEETKNPNRNIPIGLIGSLAICTIFYLLVGYSAAGLGRRAAGPGCQRHAARSRQRRDGRCLCRLRSAGLQQGTAGTRAAHDRLPDAGQLDRHRRDPGAAVGHPDDDVRQTRIFFTMSRDGLLPECLSACIRASTRRMSSPSSPASWSRLCSACSRSASSPTRRIPARCWPSRWWRSAS
jgi:APA family basic amino acid/polyamine antiporter